MNPENNGSSDIPMGASRIALFITESLIVKVFSVAVPI